MIVTKLKAKIFLGLGVISLLALLYFYVNGLNSKIDSLKENNIKLEEVVKENDKAISEQIRRSGVIDDVNSLGDKERVIIQKEYITKINKVDKNVNEGKDKPVGELLNDFFSDGLR